MELRELVYAQAVTLAGQQERSELLKLLCGAAVTGLEGRLREGLTVDSCKADFVAAAALYALAALSEAGDISEFRAGDLTVKRGGGAATSCLRRQAELMMTPYLVDGFAFLGV